MAGRRQWLAKRQRLAEEKGRPKRRDGQSERLAKVKGWPKAKAGRGEGTAKKKGWPKRGRPENGAKCGLRVFWKGDQNWDRHATPIVLYSIFDFSNKLLS